MEHCNCDKDSINSSTEKSEDFEEMVSNDSNYMPLKKKTSIIVNKVRCMRKIISVIRWWILEGADK